MNLFLSDENDNESITNTAYNNNGDNDGCEFSIRSNICIPGRKLYKTDVD